MNAREHAWSTVWQRLHEKSGLTPRSSAMGISSRGQQPNCPVQEERRVRAEQSQPKEPHHTITTARRPDNARSSALVRSQSTRDMAAQTASQGDNAPK